MKHCEMKSQCCGGPAPKYNGALYLIVGLVLSLGLGALMLLAHYLMR